MLDETSKCTPELSKEDLLRLLACLQSELEARDVVIGTLKSERQGLINVKAKYGVTNFENCKPALVDPYEALQRDSMMYHGHNSVDKSDLRQHYDSQLAQLECLISSQRIAQEKLREQLNFMETKYIKMRGALVEEKRKHEHETAQGDDVLVMLEKERERLKSEVDYEKSQNEKLEKDIKRLVHVWKEQSLLLERQKEVTVSLLIERRRYLQRLSKSENVSNEKPQIECVDFSIQTSFYGTKMGEPICNDETNVGTTHCDQISILQENLEVEKACRSEVELNFERLKEGYAKLLAEVNLLRSSKLSTHGDDDHDVSSVTDCASTTLPSCSSTSVSSGDFDVKLTESTSSIVMPPRTKPPPPTRRSSEVTNMTVPFSCHPPAYSPTLIPAVNGLSDDEQLVNTNDVYDCTETAQVSPTRMGTANGDFPVESSSRSSTPSPPPPPPPPVQLHYPYPGMQSHLQNSHSRVPTAGSTGSNSEGFFSRLIGCSLVSTSPYAVVRPRQPPISNLSSYASLNSGSLVHRMNLPPTSVRPSAYHTPVSVNFQQQHKIIPQPFPTTLVTSIESSFHTKSPPVTATAPANLGQRRKSPLPGTPQSQTQVYPLTQHQNQPFPSYSPRYHHHPRAPLRYPTGGGVGTNGNGGSNATVSPSVPDSHAVSRTIRAHTSSGPPEHVCIGGK